MADPSLIAKPRMEYARPTQQSGRGRGLGILILIAALFCFLTAAAYGGIRFYRQSLEEALDGLTRELAQLEEDLDADIIQEIARVDRGLRTARSLLAAHIYSSNLFALLEDHTLTGVYYTSFKYTSASGVTLGGKAGDFVALHRQLEGFRALPLVTTLTLDDIRLADDEEGPGIEFVIRMTLAENVFRFR